MSDKDKWLNRNLIKVLTPNTWKLAQILFFSPHKLIIELILYLSVFSRHMGLQIQINLIKYLNVYTSY